MLTIRERLQAALRDTYAVERELGRGGMATVFLAHDRKHDRAVAIKVLHPELAATIGADRFEREIRLAAKLQHPHILGLYDSGVAEGLLYYVMPFVQGESLRDRLDREGQLPIDDAVQIALEVADALGAAHQQQIIHRDIKPENVLLSGGHALVADFGIARAASEGGGQKLTQTGMAVGTPVYMAPEQSVGDSIGPTADLYSLGCVLYEMLAGEPPFTAKSPQALMARHAMEAVPSVRIVRTTVPEEIEDAIFAAMAKVPADRPQTAAQFAEALGLPLGATASRRASIRATASRRVPTQARLPAARRRSIWWRHPWLLGLGVVLIGAGGWLAWRATGSERAGRSTLGLTLPPSRIAVLYFRNPSGDADLDAVADGLTEGLIRALANVRGLTVVSRNGVAPFRDRTVPVDSVARALKAGTVVDGTVDAEGGDRIRIRTRLIDETGADLGKQTSIVLDRDQLFAAEDSVAQEVSRTLREWLGSEIEIRQSEAGTRSTDAWTLLSRAERVRKRAAGLAVGDSGWRAALENADTLLAEASRADDHWAAPLVLRGEIAFERGREPGEPSRRSAFLDRGGELAEAALALDPRNAAALALRGKVRFAEWSLARSPDPAVRALLLKAAEKDLEAAVAADPSLASAYAQLTFVYYADKSVGVFTALQAARNAYEADAYLSMADLILHRLFWASYDTDQFADAVKWCEEGHRRFPTDVRFTECQLWLLLTPGSQPDIGTAWRLAARSDSFAAPDDRPFESHLTRLIVGGVIGRAAKAAPVGAAKALLADSADRVLTGARAGRDVDPHQELEGYEAVMRTQMGDYPEAIDLLRRYVAVNPDHSFQVEGNIHWWWRDLRNNPDFQRVMARR